MKLVVTESAPGSGANGAPAPPGFSRRALLKWGLAGAAATLVGPVSVWAEAMEAGGHRTPQALAVYKRLHGPLASLAPPFTHDYQLDEDSLHRWIDFMCDQEAPVIFFTFGDGEIDSLTEDEIGRINLIAAERTRGTKTLAVGATGPWWTGRTIDFVRRMEDGGLEAINIHFSPRISGERMIHPALQQISEKTDLPLLLYDDNQMPTSLITQAASISQVVGVKSHGSLYAFYAQAKQTDNTHFAVLGAGQMKQYLYGAQVGSPAYLCPLAPVAPRVSKIYYKHVQAGRWDEARQMVTEYEDPLLKCTIPLGYPQAYKAQAHLAGFYSTPYVRPPRLSPRDEALSSLKDFLLAKGLIT